MSTLLTAFKNSLVLSAANVVTKIVTIFYLAYVANKLRPEQYGLYNFALGYMALFQGFTELGLSDLFIREIARERSAARKYLENALSLKIGLFVLTVILVSCSLPLLRRPEEDYTVLYLALALLLIYSLCLTFRTVFVAFEIMEQAALGDLFERFFTFVIGLAVLWAGGGVAALMGVLVAGAAVKLWYYARAARRIAPFGFSFDKTFAFDYLRRAFPFGAGHFVGVVYARVSIVMLALMLGYREAGLFSAANDKIFGAASFSLIVTYAFFPTLSKTFLSARSEAVRIYEEAVRYLYMLGLPASVGIMLTSDRIVGLLHTSDYSATILPLQILAPYIVLRFLSYAVMIVLTSVDRQGVRVGIESAGCAIFVVANFLLIRWWGVVGACVAAVATEAVLLVALYGAGCRYFVPLPVVRLLWKPSVATVAMAGVTLILRHSNFGLQVGLAVVTYFLVLLALGELRKDWEKIFRAMPFDGMPPEG